MATLERRLAANVDGEFFVDASCIDCGACMWIAPKTFDEAGDQSRVHHQPVAKEEIDLAELALIACPTGSIGTTARRKLAPAIASYPRLIAENVHHCGFHAESTFGAASWLIVRKQGNVLVDVPRFVAPLVKRIEALGGVKTIFLTHKDDVGDQARFAAHFAARRVMHAADVEPSTRDVERVIDGEHAVRLAEDLLVIPTPGHTRGSACLLHRDKFLFSGDHVAWNEELGHPYAFKSACWYDWNVLRESMRRLAQYEFEWILPGHGAPCHFAVDEMRRRMESCLAWMERT